MLGLRRGIALRSTPTVPSSNLMEDHPEAMEVLQELLVAEVQPRAVYLSALEQAAYLVEFE